MAENDLADCLTRWRSRDSAKDTDRTSKAFYVSASEIKSADYDLSLSRYKESTFVEREYARPQIILGRMQNLYGDIAKDIGALEEMLG